jgi:hypothetical protein
VDIEDIAFICVIVLAIKGIWHDVAEFLKCILLYQKEK